MHRAGLIKNIFLPSFLLMIVFVPTVTFASVASEINKANDLYRQGKFDDSLGLYQQALERDAQSPVVKYDYGTALYKKGDYAKALGYLEQASQDKNFKIKTKAEYNLGNTLYKSGVQKENTNVDEAIKTLQEALGHYGQTIAQDPKDQDALFNQDVVKKEIERLKQKKQQQQQQQEQESQQQQNQNQQQQQNQQQKQQKQQQNQQERQQKDQNNQATGQQQQSQQQQASSQKQPQGQQKQNAQARPQESQKELDRKQAEDLLEEYQQNQEPKKLLNYRLKKIDERPVLKDW